MVYIREFDRKKDTDSFYEMERKRGISGKLFDRVFDFMMKEMEEKKVIRFAIIHEASNTLIGFCQLDMEDSETPEIGIDIFEQYWGKGYGTKAVKLIIEYASEWEGIDHFKWVAKQDNLRSKRIAEKMDGILVEESPLYSDTINKFGLESGIFRKEDIVCVCRYKIPKMNSER